MSIQIIQQRLLEYQCKNILEQENALKEIAQEIALMSLSRANFFKGAAFQGGTALRILYGLERFSEDLDFILDAPNNAFSWSSYMKNMTEEFNTYGYALEIQDKSNVDKNVRMAFLKADSMGGLLIIKDIRTNKPKLRIKLEIDTNPPAGSTYKIKYLDFPLPFAIKTQDLGSLFAGKCHALLCRDYAKGRDWYDFIWYVARKTPINFKLLKNAINQAGPWKNLNMKITPRQFTEQLRTKIHGIDWAAAKTDVAPFLRPHELISLDVWSTDFFLSRVDKLEEYLA